MKIIKGMLTLVFLMGSTVFPAWAMETVTTTTTTPGNSQEVLRLEDFEHVYAGTTKPGRAYALAFEKYQEYKNSSEYPDTTLIPWPRNRAVSAAGDTNSTISTTTTRTAREPVVRTTVTKTITTR